MNNILFDPHIGKTSEDGGIYHCTRGMFEWVASGPEVI